MRASATSAPGCPFAPRCDKAFEPCATLTPELVAVAFGHDAACHLNDRRFDGPALTSEEGNT